MRFLNIIQHLIIITQKPEITTFSILATNYDFGLYRAV